jgi:hypothetical protein
MCFCPAVLKPAKTLAKIPKPQGKISRFKNPHGGRQNGGGESDKVRGRVATLSSVVSRLTPHARRRASTSGSRCSRDPPRSTSSSRRHRRTAATSRSRSRSSTPRRRSTPRSRAPRARAAARGGGRRRRGMSSPWRPPRSRRRRAAPDRPSSPSGSPSATAR